MTSILPDILVYNVIIDLVGFFIYRQRPGMIGRRLLPDLTADTTMFVILLFGAIFAALAGIRTRFDLFRSLYKITEHSNHYATRSSH